MAEEKKSGFLDGAVAAASAVALFGSPQMRSSLAAGSAAAGSALGETAARFERWIRYNAPAWANAFLRGGFMVMAALSIFEAYAISELSDASGGFWWNWIKAKLLCFAIVGWYLLRTNGSRFVPWAFPVEIEPPEDDYGPGGRPALSAFLALVLALVGSGITAIAARSSLCTYNKGLDPLSTIPLLVIGCASIGFAIVYTALVSAIGKFGGEAGDWGFGVGGSIFRAIHAALLPGVDTDNSREVVKQLASPFGRIGNWIWGWMQAVITASIAMAVLAIFITKAQVFGALSLCAAALSGATLILERSYVDFEVLFRMKRFRAWAIYAFVGVLGTSFMLDVLNKTYKLTDDPYGPPGAGWEALKQFAATSISGAKTAFGAFGFFFLTMKWYSAVFIVMPAAVIGMMMLVRHWHPEGKLGRFSKANALLAIVAVLVLTLLGFVVRVDGQTVPDRIQMARHVLTERTPNPVAEAQPAVSAPPRAGLATRAYNALFAPDPNRRATPAASRAPHGSREQARLRARTGSRDRYELSPDFRALEAEYAR